MLKSTIPPIVLPSLNVSYLEFFQVQTCLLGELGQRETLPAFQCTAAIQGFSLFWFLATV